jgi:hypothetical protein
MAEEIAADCSTMWFARTKTNFDMEVAKFLSKWDQQAPTYAKYFRDNWLDRFPPEEWASFGRPSDYPSGILCLVCILY